MALQHSSNAVEVIEQMNQQLASAALEQSAVVEEERDGYAALPPPM